MNIGENELWNLTFTLWLQWCCPGHTWYKIKYPHDWCSNPSWPSTSVIPCCSAWAGHTWSKSTLGWWTSAAAILPGLWLARFRRGLVTLVLYIGMVAQQQLYSYWTRTANGCQSLPRSGLLLGRVSVFPSLFMIMIRLRISDNESHWSFYLPFVPLLRWINYTQACKC